MPDIDRNEVLTRLRSVAGPDGTGDIVALGLVSDIVVSGSKVMFSITVPADRAGALDPLRQAAEKAVLAAP
nr:iron-sulfur cluster assembly protein [Bauldia sp.]